MNASRKQASDGPRQAQQRTPSKPGVRAWLALIGPFVLMLGVSLVSGVAGHGIGRTLLGMLGAAIGGLAAGITVKRFLAHGKNDLEMFFGVGATTAIGVIAIGYLYMFTIDTAQSNAPTLARNVEQTFVFVEFLTAQYTGTLWAHRVFPHVNRPDETP